MNRKNSKNPRTVYENGILFTHFKLSRNKNRHYKPRSQLKKTELYI